jgi:transposase
MKPCPLELRERIVGAVDQQTHTIAELADLFQVSERYIYKLLQLRRETGDLTPLPHSGGTAPLLDDAKLLQLAQWIAHQPDATLKELQTLVRRHLRLEVCLTTIWAAVNKLDLTVKKNTPRPGSRSAGARRLSGQTTPAASAPPLVSR